MKPKIIGQAYGSPDTIIVQTGTTDEGWPLVRIMDLVRNTIFPEDELDIIVRFMPCEDYQGTATLEEILTTRNLTL